MIKRMLHPCLPSILTLYIQEYQVPFLKALAFIDEFLKTGLVKELDSSNVDFEYDNGCDEDETSRMSLKWLLLLFPLSFSGNCCI